MYLAQIQLRDWKSYTSANFEFPEPHANSNVVLIGAPNGFGKTSLFEAVILGLFGREGLPLIARSQFLSGDNDRLAISYKSFLEKVLHRGAALAGRNSCSVKIKFVNENDEPLEIQRIWHFSDSASYRPQDEEVHIYFGATRKAVGPSGLTGSERVDWFRDYIAENLIPFTLAHFFMFDGEQVSVLAEREMSAQVRAGIEGLLGIPVLKKLANDLRTYAQIRRKGVSQVSDTTIERLETERDELQEKMTKCISELQQIEPNLDTLRKEREDLTRELSSFGAGSQALMQEQFERIKGLERIVEQGESKLEDLLVQDIALALSGAKLRKSVTERLTSESIRERWENGKSQGDKNLDRFLSAMEDSLRSIEPELSSSQQVSILAAAQDSWMNLWYPAPLNCAVDYHHPYLNELERSKIIDCLNELDKLGAPAIVELLDDTQNNERELQRLREEVTRTEAVKPHVDTKRERLTAINGEIQVLDRRVGALNRERESLEAQINNKNIELTRMASSWDAAQPALRRAQRALKVGSIVDEIVQKAVPSQVDAIAREMTKAFSSMAHKKDLVDRVQIDDNCEVKLLNSSGVDIRTYDLSAGEKQIFTQSLISAVTSVSGWSFPMIVDTPLGRLDMEHRKGVLNHLTRRNGQVILLSTDTEVVGEYLRDIESHVQKTYLLSFDRIGDIGESKVTIGFFNDSREAA